MITAHDGVFMGNYGPAVWQERTHTDESNQDSGQHCSWCGSITVDRAIALMKMPGVHFSGADWKYGWPHKFTFDVPNPDADKLVPVGSESGVDEEGKRFNKPIMGYRRHLYAKFYNDHLIDATDEQIEEFSRLSQSVFGIVFKREGGKLKYGAPKSGSSYGYQLWGIIDDNGKPDHSPMRA